MIVLGLLFILLAVVATAVAVTAPIAAPQVVKMSALGVSVSASPRAMFLAGGVSVLLLVFGLALISGGARRRARSRKELRELRKDQGTSSAGTSEDTAAGSSRRDGSHDGTKTDTTGTDTTRTSSTRLHPDSAPPA